MRRIIVPERWDQIIAMVEERGSATVEEIAQGLAISSATVRRDLARIHQRGLIERTRGGALPSQHVRVGLTLAESRRANPYEKELIGRVAAELIEPDDTLMIDGGFTTYQVVRHMSATGISVVTNSFDVAQALAGRDDATLVIVGGVLNSSTGTTVGPLTEQQIHQLCADKAILGADTVSPERGLSTPHPLTAQTKKAMIERSGEVIIVADYTKLGRDALYNVCPVGSIATLVTDDKADAGVLDAFRSAGVEVIVASSGGQDGERDEPK